MQHPFWFYRYKCYSVTEQGETCVRMLWKFRFRWFGNCSIRARQTGATHAHRCSPVSHCFLLIWEGDLRVSPEFTDFSGCPRICAPLFVGLLSQMRVNHSQISCCLRPPFLGTPSVPSRTTLTHSKRMPRRVCRHDLKPCDCENHRLFLASCPQWTIDAQADA